MTIATLSTRTYGIDKAIVMLNQLFVSGQAYVALSRVCNSQDLMLWDYDPNLLHIIIIV